ncbi:MAG: type II toxin-antitoxin system RelE/ParE family toxin [Calditrichaceae bacterium]|nr:type II toxin-antitoxin system RelE/ParE family toxin [Calditrichaceae bacterium]MBN2707965.1 type II toxin-antitoxin system RelE/ParE family toxin [Calditrichaceae bacterium]RQV95934.1 MAG: type II toxin-antitoxin system RelE/ParE family toxin [Calditrichota bacterium]
MKYEVFLTEDAQEDIFGIYNYVALNDSIDKADSLFEKLQETCLSLENYPDRGHLPPELERINVREYSEIHFKPYRIIYQIRNRQVFIHCVLEGRRNLQDILQERILR